MPDVYDKEKEETGYAPGQHDDLGVHPEHREAEAADLENLYNSPSAEEPDLRSAEENPASPAKATADPKEGYKAGFGYRDEGTKKKKEKAKGSFIGRNKKWFIGGGVGAGVGGVALTFMLLLPLKVQHVANNLQSHFFASSEQATTTVTDRLLGQYLVKKVIPGMAESEACTTTKVNKSCAAVSPGDGPVSRLYNVWRDNNLEGKLAEKHGLEIRKEGKTFYLYKNGQTIFSGVFDSHKPGAFENKMFAAMSKNEIRREFRKAYENETLAKRLLYRYKVGNLLERKYGIKRCLVACETRDKRQDKKEAKVDRKAARKLKWQFYFIDRVTNPRSEMLGLALKCAMAEFGCTKSDRVEDDGQKTSEIQRDLQETVKSANLSEPDAKKLEEDAKAIREKGLAAHIVSKLAGQMAGKAVTGAIPVVNVLMAVDTAAHIANGVEKAGPGLKKLNYVINSASMVTTYMMYRTNADEIKTGEADAEDIGIVADSLGPNAGEDQNGASAEQAPIYQEIMGSTPVTAASIFSTFTPKASAFNGYKCNDDTTITSGVCPEVMLTSVRLMANIANMVSDIAKFLPVGDVANVWINTGGRVFSAVYGVTGKIFEMGNTVLKTIIPGYGWIVDNGTALFTAIGKWFISKGINDAIGNSPSGGRNMELAAGGADVAGNDFAHYGLGAQRVSDASAAAIRLAQKQEEREAFNSSSLFARVFDTSSQYSLVSKMAMAVPFNSNTGTMQSFAGSLLSPFTTAATSVSFGSKAEAASTIDPFGVTQYAYPANSPVLKSDDLENFWNQNDCSNPDKAKNWGEASYDNSETGMPENDTPNPCKLIETAVGASGGIFDESLLGEDAPNADNTQESTDDIPPQSACYSVTKLTGEKIEGKMLHWEANTPIDSYAKENSPAGIKYAAQNGYKSIDLDIQITKDGVPVATHWNNPMVTQYGVPTPFYDPQGKLSKDAKINKMTFAEVSRLRNKDGQSQIYSLEEMIKVLSENKINLSLEIKNKALIKQFPKITELLNQYKVKAYMKADASKDELNKALQTARDYGYWTRGTEGSQGWKKPVSSCLVSPINTGSSEMGDDYKGGSKEYGVFGNQCVDFVKFRLKKHGAKYTGGALGNGKDVAKNLGSLYGYTVDHTPAVHAVVSFPGPPYGKLRDGSYAGHVAMVAQVNKDGSIVVEEYNYSVPGGYGTRTIPASTAKSLTYAHTEVDYK